MPIRVLNDFRSISEFGAYNGDCFFAAVLPFLHCLDERTYPLDFATLDRLVTEAHAAGFCEANGAINVPHASAWLTHMGIAHETYCSYGGALAGDTAPWHPFVLDDGSAGCFHQQLKTWAGRQGLVWERGQGAPLPGDEPNVVYHYPGAGGIDTGPKDDGIGGAYLCCDGDNSANPRSGAPTAAIRYTWPQIKAAGPIAFIRITAPVVYNPGAGVPAPAPVVQPVTPAALAPSAVAHVYTLTIAADGTATIKAN